MDRFRKTLPAWALLAGVLLPAAGCGLGDYERHIDAQRARIKVLDDENRVLGDLVEPPREEKSDTSYWPFTVYLRLPRGYANSVTERSQQAAYIDLALFRFPAKEGYNIFVAAGWVGKKPGPGEWPTDTFREYVRGALMEFYRAEHKVIPEFPAFDRAKLQRMTKQPVSASGAALPAMTFDVIAFTDKFNKAVEPSFFQAYFYHLPDRQIAVVFQSPLASVQTESQLQAVDWTLKTLDIGTDAAAKRAEYAKRRKGKKA
jgi:hypothetical protein